MYGQHWAANASCCVQEKRTDGGSDEYFWEASSHEGQAESARPDTSRAAEFPNLEEASMAVQQPELFKYLSSMQDILGSLRIGVFPLCALFWLDANRHRAAVNKSQCVLQECHQIVVQNVCTGCLIMIITLELWHCPQQALATSIAVGLE